MHHGYFKIFEDGYILLSEVCSSTCITQCSAEKQTEVRQMLQSNFTNKKINTKHYEISNATSLGGCIFTENEPCENDSRWTSGVSHTGIGTLHLETSTHIWYDYEYDAQHQNIRIYYAYLFFNHTTATGRACFSDEVTSSCAVASTPFKMG